jgi:hypothetical protein
MGGLGGNVALISSGTIKFGESFHQSLSYMMFEAVNLAMTGARIESRRRRRHHLHETVLQRALRHAAVWQGGLPKRASPTPSATRS